MVNHPNRSRRVSAGVQLRLMGQDEDAVRAVRAILEEALGERVVFTGEAQTKHGPGLRAYGAVSITVVPGEGRAIR